MTYERRPMPVLTVTTAENHTRLEEIRTRHLAASEPDGDPAADAADPYRHGVPAIRTAALA